jgi:hypothetical protein
VASEPLAYRYQPVRFASFLRAANSSLRAALSFAVEYPDGETRAVFESAGDRAVSAVQQLAVTPCSLFVREAAGARGVLAKVDLPAAAVRSQLASAVRYQSWAATFRATPRLGAAEL